MFDYISIEDALKLYEEGAELRIEDGHVVDVIPAKSKEDK